MIRGILKIVTWLGIVAWFAVILGFVSGEADQVLCNSIEVVISDSLQNRFVTDSDVRAILRAEGLKLQGYPLKEINTRELEKLLEENPYIRGAEVSSDVTGRMEIDIEQTVPLVRMMPEGRKGFYLDTEGKVLPLSGKFVPYVLLVTGYIDPPDKSEIEEGQVGEIYRFCSHLVNHPLWSEQIVQLYVNRKGEYELIPRVGAHQILMGSLDQWESKLEKLELLYRQGLSTYGWNSYNTINLKYTNQVICTKR
jgi:cell division protein FtsQ